MRMATATTEANTLALQSSIVSCFVAKCTETVIAAILYSSLKNKYLQQFSESNPVQREAIKAFLHGETHYVLPAIKHKDRANFVRLYAVLCSSILDDKPLLLEAIKKLYPKLQADSKLLSKITNESALTLFSVGILVNRQDYIDISLGKSKGERTDAEYDDFIDGLVEDQMDKWQSTYAFGFMELNPYASALLLYSSWSNDPAACINTLEICKTCSCITEFPAKPDMDDLSDMLARTTFAFTVSDYTKDIHSGLDLVKRIHNFYDTHTIADVVMDRPLASYALSSLNALWFADYLQPRTSIALLFSKETVSKEDRYLALRCALFQYTYAVKCTEESNEEHLQHFGDFTALSRLYVTADLQKSLLLGHNPLYGNLDNKTADYVLTLLRITSYDCIGAKFEETYLLTLYKILIERIIIRQQCEELETYFFGKSDLRDGEAEKVRRELESLYIKCGKQDAIIQEQKDVIKGLQQRVDDISQYKEKIDRKNIIIAELKKRVEELEAQTTLQEDGFTTNETSNPPETRMVEAESQTVSKATDELTDEEVHKRLLELCGRYTVALVDGHENFHRRLSEAQPQIRMLSGDDVQRKVNALATADFVFCKSSAYGSHTAMEKAISVTKGTQAHFILLSKVTNIEQCEREIYMAIMNCLNKEGKCDGE